MGKLIIDLNLLTHAAKNYDNPFENSYEISQSINFLNNFYNLGFNKNIEEINQNKNSNYSAEFNFNYSELENIKEKFKSHYSSFLDQNEEIDNLLFEIAENYFDDFISFSDEFKSPSLDESENIDEGKTNENENFEASMMLSDEYLSSLNEESVFDNYENTFESRSPNFDEVKSMLIENNQIFKDIYNDIENKIYLGKLDFEKNRQSILYLLDRLSINKDKQFKMDLSEIIDQINQINYYSELLKPIQDALELGRKNLDSLDVNYSSIIDKINSQLNNQTLNEKVSNDQSNEVPLFLQKISRLFEGFKVPKKNFVDFCSEIEKKMKIKFTKDIYHNFFAVDKIKEYHDDVKKLKNTLGDVIRNGWIEN